METTRFAPWLGTFLTVFLLSLCLIHLHKTYQDPFPPLITSLSTPVTQLSDFAGVALGFRRLAADIAWIQTLQYYGTPEPGQSEFEFENGMGIYAQFLPYCQRVIRIDPYFTYAYLYGASALGWNMDRLAEAEELLKEGIQRNPKAWRIHQYLAAMAFQKNRDIKGLISFFESALQDPDCPNLLKSILANLYKKKRRFGDAIRIWQMLYESGDPHYVYRAQQQIQLLQGYLDKNTPHLVQ